MEDWNFVPEKSVIPLTHIFDKQLFPSFLSGDHPLTKAPVDSGHEMKRWAIWESIICQYNDDQGRLDDVFNVKALTF